MGSNFISAFSPPLGIMHPSYPVHRDSPIFITMILNPRSTDLKVSTSVG